MSGGVSLCTTFCKKSVRLCLTYIAFLLSLVDIINTKANRRIKMVHLKMFHSFKEMISCFIHFHVWPQQYAAFGLNNILDG